MLTRVPVVSLDTADENFALAIEVEDLLGYTPLREHIKAPGRLQRALARLQIEVLDESSVDAYKAQMVLHYDTHNKMAQPTWRLTALADYALKIPLFVLSKAVQLKRELPEARFYVDHLAVDPFLIVCAGPNGDDPQDHVVNVKTRDLDADTQAYIEVWSEPRFEAAL